MVRLNGEGKIAFAERVFLGTLVASVVIGVLLLFGYLAQILLLVFASVLLAVFLRTLAEALARLVPLSIGASLAAVCLTLFGLIGITAWLYGPLLANGLYELWHSLPDSPQHLRKSLGVYPWGAELVDGIQRSAKSFFNPEQIAHLAGIFSSTLGALGSLIIVIVLGIYFSAEPEVYLEGGLHLVPPPFRKKAREVARKLSRALRWWLAGRIAAMTVVGTLVWLGLLLLGMAFSFILGMLAGTLSFVPNFGPVAAAVPGLLVAFSQSPSLGFYAALTYLVILTLEGYFITPLMERQAVSIPPALLLVAQLVMGLSFGLLGLMLASPLAVTVMTLVQLLYVRDVLEEPVTLPGETTSPL